MDPGKGSTEENEDTIFTCGLCRKQDKAMATLEQQMVGFFSNTNSRVSKLEKGVNLLNSNVEQLAKTNEEILAAIKTRPPMGEQADSVVVNEIIAGMVKGQVQEAIRAFDTSRTAHSSGSSQGNMFQSLGFKPKAKQTAKAGEGREAAKDDVNEKVERTRRQVFLRGFEHALTKVDAGEFVKTWIDDRVKGISADDVGGDEGKVRMHCPRGHKFVIIVLPSQEQAEELLKTIMKIGIPKYESDSFLHGNQTSIVKAHKANTQEEQRRGRQLSGGWLALTAKLEEKKALDTWRVAIDKSASQIGIIRESSKGKVEQAFVLKLKKDANGELIGCKATRG